MQYAGRQNAFDREAENNGNVDEQEHELPEPREADNMDNGPAAPNRPRAVPISVPAGNAREMRPYPALARENTEALNIVLTRAIPVMAEQLQQTVGLINEQISQQLDNKQYTLRIKVPTTRKLLLSVLKELLNL